MFVQRNAQSAIMGCFRNPQPGYATEELPDDHADVLAFLNRPSIDLSNLDNLDKALKALGLLLRDYTNALQAGTHTQKTVVQVKADFKAKYDTLP